MIELARLSSNRFCNTTNLQVDGEGNADSDSDWLFGEGSSGVGGEDIEGF